MISNESVDGVLGGERTRTFEFMRDIVREGQESLGASVRGGNDGDLWVPLHGVRVRVPPDRVRVLGIQ